MSGKVNAATHAAGKPTVASDKPSKEKTQGMAVARPVIELPSVDCSPGSNVWKSPEELAKELCKKVKSPDACIPLIDKKGLKKQRSLCKALGFDGKEKSIDCSNCSSVWKSREELAKQLCRGNSSCEALIDEDGIGQQRAICEAAGHKAPSRIDKSMCGMSVSKKVGK